MAKPIVLSELPSFPFGAPATFLIRGKNFVGDGGGNVSVGLTSADGFTWKPQPAVGTVVNDQVVSVTATPSDTAKLGAGFFDLTIVVTNGDNSGDSNSSSQEVFYG
jgi:hypothetical protein